MGNSRRKQVSAFGLPLTVLIIVPFLILLLTNDTTLGWNIHPSLNTPLMILGLAAILSGLVLLTATIRMFSKIGKGTLAPWAPTEELVVDGVYGRTRSPMISGVLIVLAGEVIILSSLWISLWFAFFAIGNHFYFIRFEEPGLLDRFGDSYQSYKDNVPRWIPQRKPWKPNQKSEET
ncbi:MAG: isoprenylcysteine carboxylmethyltransferase family protein [Candidatus Thorarchaeota archaeon]|nr:isoprenylcysteine carboxylmethyltransferase family protein [Candidatus Thorarchaeota archaeon]